MTHLSSRLAFGFLLTLVSSLIDRGVALAQIIPDQSLGSESSQTRSETIKSIESDVIEGGATRRSNLFHSFQEFSIKEGRGAYFANPEVIQNIFTRVTGGNVSNILGTLGVLGNANLFLINPSGIIFGPNARLDLRGAFLGSTADSLIFDNNFEFSATNPNAPPLLTVNIPIGLRFREKAGDISSSANLGTPGNLTLKAENLNLLGSIVAGGDLQLEALNTAKIRDSLTTPFVAAAGENLLIQGNQSIDIFALNHPASGLLSGGDMVLRSANTVGGDAHYWSGGSFRIEKLDGSLGDLFSLDDPVIRSLGNVSFDSYLGTSLHILAAGKVEIDIVIITGSDPTNGLVETIMLSDGMPVVINGQIEPTLDIRAGVDPTVVGSSFFNPVDFFPFNFDNFFFNPNIGDPPDLSGSPERADINVGTILFEDLSRNSVKGTVLLTNQYQPNPSLSGEITVGSIKTGDVFGGGHVIFDSRGGIKVERVDTSAVDLSLLGFSVPSDTFLGNGGSVTLLANDNITLIPGFSISSIGLLGGSITLKTQADILATNGSILSNSFTPIPGSKGGDINVTARLLSLAEGSIVSVRTLGQGDGGNARIDVKQLIVEDGSFISTSTFPGATGRGGDLTVIASESVELRGATSANSPSSLLSQTGGAGDGGNLTIETKKLMIRDGAGVSTQAFGQGDGGTLNVTASESVELIGTGPSSVDGLPSGLFSITSGRFAEALAGDGGNVTITTEKLIVRDGAWIDASTTSEGQAGTVKITASESVELIGTSLVDGLPSALFTETTGLFAEAPAGDAGKIAIETGRLILQDGAQISATTSTSGNGGDIDIKTGSLSLTNGTVIKTSTLGEGDAGSIVVQAKDTVSLTNNSLILSNVWDAQGVPAKGKVGNILIEARAVSLLDGAQLQAGIFSGGQGEAGIISVKAQDSISFSGTNFAGQSSGIFTDVESEAVGNGSDILLLADSISLNNGAVITARNAGEGNAGNLTIETKHLLLAEGSQVSANTTGQGDAGDIFVRAANSVDVKDGSQLRTDTSGQGNAGNVTIDAPNAVVTFDGTSIVDNELTPSGIVTVVLPVEGLMNDRTGGDINITAKSLSLSNFAQLSALTAGQGNGGDINVLISDSISLDNNALIVSTAEPGGIGDAGAITVQANSLSLNNNSQLLTNTFREGNAGNILVQVDDFITLTNRSGILSSVDKEGIGIGGDIDIQARSLSLTGGSQVQTLLFRAENGFSGGQGQAGSIEISVSDFINLAGVSPDGFSSGLFASTEKGANGPAGNITVTTNTFRIADGAVVNAFTANSGNAQNITINANTFEATGGGQVIAITRSSGNAGNITLNITNRLTLSGSDPNFAARLSQFGEDIVNNQGAESGLFANTTQGSTGEGRTITVNAPSLILDNQARINSSTEGQGNAGSILINAPNTVTLGNNSQLTVETRGAGKAGDITVTSDTLTIGKDAQLSATATDSATNTEGGGSITLNTSNLNISGQLGIFAETQSNSPAGNLTIKPNNDNPNLNIRFTDNGFISARTFKTGEGGDISISASQTVDIRGQGKITVETTGSGNAGTIDIATQNLTLADGLEISASTTGAGSAGRINLNAAQINLSQTQVNAFTNNTGNAGSISLSNQGNNASQVALNNDSRISTEIQSQGQANQPSNIDIKTDNLTLNNSTITASTEGKGDAGSISVPNAQNITLNQSEITASTSGEGDTGVINLNANQKLDLTNSQINSAVEQGAVGNSQQITLNTPNLDLNASEISAATAGQGNAGSIVVPNANTVTLDNSTISTAIAPTGIATQPSNITLNTQQLTLGNQSQITASTEGKGDAGNIKVPDAQQITLNQSEITTSTSGEGNTGIIGLNANQKLTLTNSQINSAIEKGAVGDSQQITINTPNLNLNDSEISAETEGQGNAGSIIVPNATSVTLDNSIISTAIASTGIATQPSNITLNTQQLTLDNQSKITTAIEANSENHQQGQGIAGSITVPNAQIITLNNNSNITASTAGRGNTGEIILNAHQKLELNNSRVNSAVEKDAVGNSQQITLNTPNLNLLNNSTVSAATDGTGNAGSLLVPNTQTINLDNSTISTEIQEQGIATQRSNITLTSDILNLNNNSKITASTLGTGNAGDITLTNRQLNLNNNSNITAKSTGFGNAGSIILPNTQNLNLNQSQISVSTNQKGDAGSIIVPNAQTINLNQSSITASTSGEGNTGVITLNGTEKIELSNNSEISNAVEMGGSGNAQTITLQTPQLSLQNSTITSSTNGIGNAGSIIVLNAQTINLDNSTISTEIQQSGVATEASNITLTSDTLNLDNNSNITASTSGTGNAGNITFNNQRLNLNNNSLISATSSGVGNAGSISLPNTQNLNLNQSNISVSTSQKGDAGSITVPTAVNINLNQSNITASTLGFGNTGVINLTGTEKIALNESEISNAVETGGIGNAQTITLTTPQLSLQNSSISSSTAGEGNAGSIIVPNAQTISLDNSTISSAIAPTGQATQPSNITLSSDTLNLNNNSNITASTSGVGNAGEITLINQQVNLNDNSNISATSTGVGNAGSISLPNTQNLSLNQSEISVSTTREGNAGSITVPTARQINLNQSQITASTSGMGDTGIINLSGSEQIALRESEISNAVLTEGVGNAQIITLNTPQLNLNNSTITSSTSGMGNAGSIIIPNAQIISLDNSSISTAIAFTGNATEPSNINLQTQQLTLDSNSQITATTSGFGDAGKITITADRLTSTGRSSIQTNTSSSGQAGDIVFTLQDSLTLNDSTVEASTDPNSTGDGGNISIDPKTVTLTDGARISVNNQGLGNGGNISLFAQNLTLNNGSSISATTASGEGGNITLNVPNTISQRNNSPITAKAGGTGNGGNVTLKTKFLIGNDNSDITANAFEGAGGKINITADGIFRGSDSEITASSQLGIDGVVQTDTPEVDPSRGLINLPQNLVDPNALISQNACRKGGQSEFTVRGRGGLPSTPEQVQSSNEVEVGLVGASELEATTKPVSSTSITTRKIIPAQGWRRNAKGEMVLVAYPTTDGANRQVATPANCSSN